MDIQHPTTFSRVTVHDASIHRRTLVAAVFVVLYAYAGQWCYETAGEPLTHALKEISEKEAFRNATLAMNVTSTITTTEDLLEEMAELEKEPHHNANETLPTMTSPKPLPSVYLPNAWAGALLFLVRVNERRRKASLFATSLDRF